MKNTERETIKDAVRPLTESTRGQITLSALREFHHDHMHGLSPNKQDAVLLLLRYLTTLPCTTKEVIEATLREID